MTIKEFLNKIIDDRKPSLRVFFRDDKGTMCCELPYRFWNDYEVCVDLDCIEDFWLEDNVFVVKLKNKTFWNGTGGLFPKESTANEN